MPGNAATSPADCNCFAIRSAARHVSQLYDQILAPTGLRTTQFSILAHLKKGPRTINALAKERGPTARSNGALLRRGDLLDLFAASIAPSVYGHEYEPLPTPQRCVGASSELARALSMVKKAIFLLLLGGVERNLENGTHIRG